MASNFSALKLKCKDFVGYEVCKYILNKGNQFHQKLTTVRWSAVFKIVLNLLQIQIFEKYSLCLQ